MIIKESHLSSFSFEGVEPASFVRNLFLEDMKLQTLSFQPQDCKTEEVSSLRLINSKENKLKQKQEVLHVTYVNQLIPKI